jgi:hypothetical protein
MIVNGLHARETLVFVALLTLALAVCLGTGISFAWADLREPSPLYAETETWKPLVFAQNEENKPAQKDENGHSSERKESDLKTEINSKEKDLKPGSNSKTLKRFVPSEEIEADQSVDFPYDI